MPIFARQAYLAGVDQFGVLLPRFALAAVLLALIAAARGARWPCGRNLIGLLALGGLGYVGQSLLYFTALQHASAGLVALLLYAYPFLVVALAAILLRERPGVRQILALPAAAIGLVLTIGGGNGTALGVVLGLAAALVYSFYIVGGTRIMRQVDPLVAAAIVCAAAAVSLACIGAVRAALGLPVGMPRTAAGWWPVMAIVLFSTVLAISAFFVGLRWLGASLTSVLSTLEPVVSVVLGALVLHETVGVQQAVGGAIVIAAAIWLALEKPR